MSICALINQIYSFLRTTEVGFLGLVQLVWLKELYVDCSRYGMEK
jgi:hypothetical protein